jgi:thioredoxin 1
MNIKAMILSVVSIGSVVMYAHDANQPIYLHELISQKTTKAWDPFLAPILGKGDVVLNFFAYYCGPCKAMSSLIDGVAAEMSNITFVKVQWELFDILTKKYNITSIPTLIFLRDGKEIGRYDGGPLTQCKLIELVVSVYGDK